VDALHPELPCFAEEQKLEALRYALW
jgi:hypothetical protein